MSVHSHDPAADPTAGVAPDTVTTQGERSARAAWSVNLRQRIATAAILIPLVIGLVWFGGWIAFAGAAVTLLLAAREAHAMFARKGWRPLTGLSAAIGLGFLLAAMLRENRALLLELGISALVICSFVWLMATRRMGAVTVVDWALTLAIPLYLGWPLALLLALRGEGSGPTVPGFWWTLILLLGVWANDTAALFAGHAFGRGGRHKLAPQISPNKTWEGALGGFISCILVVSLVMAIADHALARPLALPWYHGVLLGALISVAATLGDLAKSMLKRGVGVKDSGTLLPGHGGILDRADSLLFAAIIVYFYAYLFATGLHGF
jgi:phosphatidate cytidylyltransferase